MHPEWLQLLRDQRKQACLPSVLQENPANEYDLTSARVILKTSEKTLSQVVKLEDPDTTF